MELKSKLADDIFEAFENELKAVCDTPNKMLSEDLSSVLLASGKRVRPRLAILCASLGRLIPKQIVPVMVALELAHCASLMHDDVIDSAMVRRGIPTINSKRNNNLAILAGDYLLGMIEEYANKYIKQNLIKSIKQNITKSDNNAFSMTTISRLICEMCVGEYMQQEVSYSVEKQTFERYLRQVELKTGVFMKYCCVAGGVAGNLSAKKVQILGRMGLALGMAFQVSDDILDYSDKAEVGKSVGQDFLCGIYNLPMICAIEKSKGNNSEIIAIAEKLDKSEQDIERLNQFVVENDGINESKKHRDNYIQQALDELSFFSKNKAYEQLSSFVQLMAKRAF